MGKTKPNHHPYAKAQRHLKRRDPVLKGLIERVGACSLRPDPDGFAVLVRSIISQQISTKAAAAIRDRLVQALGPRGIEPRTVASASEATLRAAGLSAAKVRSLYDLAEKSLNGIVGLADLPHLPDEEVIAQLVVVRGIGRWTAEMFLIFSLGRLDVLPIADYGLRAGVRKQYQLPELPAKDELQELADAWRPYRTVGTWFIWRSFGNVPQSETGKRRASQ